MTKTSFTQPIHTPAPMDAPEAATVDAPVLDAERLDVFHVAVEFHRLVPTLTPQAGRNLRDQLGALRSRKRTSSRSPAGALLRARPSFTCCCRVASWRSAPRSAREGFCSV